MLAKLSLRGCALAAFVSLLPACPPGDDSDKCPVKSEDYDMRRVPALVHAPGDFDGQGSVKQSGAVSVLVETPGGSFTLSMRFNSNLGQACIKDDDTCEYIGKVDASLSKLAPNIASGARVGDFHVRCKKGKCAGDFELSCAKSTCKATFQVPVTLAVTAPLATQLIVAASASVSGDSCAKQLPYVDVVLAGWPEPPPVDMPDDPTVGE